MLSLVGLGSTAGDVLAQAPVLTELGPTDPVAGFPQYYGDANGLRLGLCQNPAVCFFELPNPAAPIHFPTSATDPLANYPDEQFYFAANGGMTGPSASFIYVSALEAAFANGPVEIGQQMVFTRMRLRVTGLVDGASYVITHPYGSITAVAGVDGPTPGTINITEDVGAGAPGQFALALNGNVGPFLTPVGFINGGPGTFIADGATEVAYTGSPLGTNFLRISGPSAGTLFPANAIDANTAQVDTMVLQGQVATTLGAGIAKAYVSKQGVQTAVNVWAFAAPGSILQASVAGALPVSMTERGATGQFFGRVLLGAAAAPTSVTVTNFSDVPASATSLSPLTDLVTVQSAVFTVGGDLVITASSSDQLGNPALTAVVDGLGARVLTATGAGGASGAVGLGLLPPPDHVQVTSAAGGSMIVPVAVVENAAPPAPVVANAGPDQTVAAGAAVALSGAASTGPIATFAWTHDAGALIALVGANTATPSFVAPSRTVPTDITLTLTVRSAAGLVSTDAVIVHVLATVPPPPPPPTVDVVTINDARYIVSRNQWRVAGSVTPAQGQRLTVYLGAAGDVSRPIGSLTVGATGGFSLQTAQGSGPAPQAGDTQIWVSSSAGGSRSATFRLN